MDSELLVQIATILGALIAGLGSALFFSIRFIVKQQRVENRTLVETFKKSTDQYEKSVELFKRAIESIEAGHNKMNEALVLSRKSVYKLRKEVALLREQLTKCA